MFGSGAFGFARLNLAAFGCYVPGTVYCIIVEHAKYRALQP